MNTPPRADSPRNSHGESIRKQSGELKAMSRGLIPVPAMLRERSADAYRKYEDARRKNLGSKMSAADLEYYSALATQPRMKVGKEEAKAKFRQMAAAATRLRRSGVPNKQAVKEAAREVYGQPSLVSQMKKAEANARKSDPQHQRDVALRGLRIANRAARRLAKTGQGVGVAQEVISGVNAIKSHLGLNGLSLKVSERSESEKAKAREDARRRRAMMTPEQKAAARIRARDYRSRMTPEQKLAASSRAQERRARDAAALGRTYTPRTVTPMRAGVVTPGILASQYRLPTSAEVAAMAAENRRRFAFPFQLPLGAAGPVAAYPGAIDSKYGTQ